MIIQGFRARFGLALLLAATATACATKRILIVESDPPGAVVRLDELVIGRTPIEHEFTHYGHRRLTLYMPGFRTWSQPIKLDEPWHSRFPIDIFTELLIPMGIDDRHVVPVVLVPDAGVTEEPDLEALLDRARKMREDESLTVSPPPLPTTEGDSDPEDPVDPVDLEDSDE